MLKTVRFQETTAQHFTYVIYTENAFGFIAK